MNFMSAPPFAAITASTLLGKLSTRFRSVYGSFWPFFQKHICEVRHWCWTESLAHSLRSNSSQRCSIGLRSGLCAGQSGSSTPNWLIHVFMDLALCSGAVMLEQEGAIPKLFPQSWEHEMVQNLLVCWSIPFCGWITIRLREGGYPTMPPGGNQYGK